MDTTWVNQRNYWERVRWARLQWQQRTGTDDTARSAAESLGMDENTYTTYERPPRSSRKDLSVERARQFGQKFKVSWVWLAVGEGSPFDSPASLSPEARQAAEIIEEAPEAERPELVAAIKTLLRRTGAGG